MGMKVQPMCLPAFSPVLTSVVHIFVDLWRGFLEMAWLARCGVLGGPRRTLTGFLVDDNFASLSSGASYTAPPRRGSSLLVLLAASCRVHQRRQ